MVYAVIDIVLAIAVVRCIRRPKIEERSFRWQMPTESLSNREGSEILGAWNPTIADRPTGLGREERTFPRRTMPVFGLDRSLRYPQWDEDEDEES